jgi:hypothetical protein
MARPEVVEGPKSRRPLSPAQQRSLSGDTLSPEQRTLRARIGGLSLHAQVDSREHLAPARAAFMARFDREVDPDGVLPAAERARRAELARKVYFTRLALKSSRARSKRKAGGRNGNAM